MNKERVLLNELYSQREFTCRFDCQQEENLHGMRLSIVPIEEGEIAIRIFAGGKFTGLICGRLYAEPDVEALFIVNSSNNMTRSEPKERRVPAVVRNTIAHAVSTGLVDEWRSDRLEDLKDGARIMYGQYLAFDERLDVAHPSEQTGMRYVVKIKK